MGEVVHSQRTAELSEDLKAERRYATLLKAAERVD